MIEDRKFVIPDDVKYLSVPVLAHRVIPKGYLHGGHRRALEQVDDESGHTEGFDDHVDVHEERNEAADRHAAVQDLVTTEAENGQRANRRQCWHPRHHQ